MAPTKFVCNLWIISVGFPLKAPYQNDARGKIRNELNATSSGWRACAWQS